MLVSRDIKTSKCTWI